MADDNRDMADSLVELLWAAGYDARAAYDGIQAVQACRAAPPAVALLDVQMPAMDGCEAARRIRLAPASPARIASISALELDEEPLRSMGHHFDDHFHKPVDAAALLAFLRKWAAKRRCD